MDIVVGFAAWKHWELEIGAAAFEFRAAYGERAGGRAYAGILKVSFNF